MGVMGVLFTHWLTHKTSFMKRVSLAVMLWNWLNLLKGATKEHLAFVAMKAATKAKCFNCLGSV